MSTNDTPVTAQDIAKVRGYLNTMNERVTDEQVSAALVYFGRDSHRHMLAARSIARSLAQP